MFYLNCFLPNFDQLLLPNLEELPLPKLDLLLLPRDSSQNYDAGDQTILSSLLRTSLK